jgi:DNA-binding MarR family transcriptional regulator
MVRAMTSTERFDPIAEARRRWIEHWGDEPTPAMVAVTSIMRAQQILMGRLNALLKPFDLTFPRYEALMILYLSRRGSMPLGKLGARLQVHPTSVTSLIDGLERSGHLRRTAHAEDRRTTLAEITEQGRAVAAGATDALNRARFGVGPLADDDLDAIAAAIDPLREDADAA